ncbi:MAG: LEA type 2 family protein [Nanoarchaeota archaeon]|nr:LEA type 2 family protein [Nanoarchaeota archaeon]
MKFTALLKIAVPILAALGILAFFVLGTKVSVEDFRVTGISDLSTDTFVVNGLLEVKNTGKVGIPIESIAYDIFLKKTGEKLGSGTVPSVTIRPRGVTPVRLNQQVRWVPTALLAADLATEKGVPAIIKGEVVIALPKDKVYRHQFSAEVDIKEYVLQFLPESVKDINDKVETIREPVKNVTPELPPRGEIPEEPNTTFPVGNPLI